MEFFIIYGLEILTSFEPARKSAEYKLWDTRWCSPMHVLVPSHHIQNAVNDKNVRKLRHFFGRKKFDVRRFVVSLIQAQHYQMTSNQRGKKWFFKNIRGHVVPLSLLSTYNYMMSCVCVSDITWFLK